MERTKVNKTPTAILTSDWHLRETIPICRTDNYWKAQWKKVDYISMLQKKYNCPVIHAGDLYDKWKITTYLSKVTMQHLPNQFHTIYGQHDLPSHSIQLSEKCGIDLLQEAGKLTVLNHKNPLISGKSIIYGLQWSQLFPTKLEDDAPLICLEDNDKIVLVWHHLTYQQKPFPGASGGMAAGLLRKYPQFDLIVTGDNHQAFTEEHEGRLLVNPGSLMRMDADQIDFKPRVYLWYADTNTVTPVYLPIEEGVVSRDHIDRVEQRNNRIDAFISKLDGDWKAGTSFEQNLEEFKKKNQVRDKIMDIIYKAIENE